MPEPGLAQLNPVHSLSIPLNPAAPPAPAAGARNTLSPRKSSPTGLVEDLVQRLGPAAVLTDPDAKAAYTLDWRKKYPSDALAVVRPDSTDLVAEAVKVCARHGVSITPQSGNTGLVGGSVPTQPSREIVLSLDRMGAVEDVDPVGNTMLVQTGCILAHAQQAAEAEDRLFPLSLGAEGTCRIGGNLSTNAGGINVLKYGNMRDLVLGLEVVLADGRIWNGLNRLRKDNTGYDLKNLFIGAEGSLGIITRAVLKLFPRPRDRVTLWLACASPAACLAALNAFRGQLGEAVMAGEIMPRIAVEQALSLISGLRPPLPMTPPWSLLLEVGVFDERGQINETVDALLNDALQAGIVQDGVIAQTSDQARALWQIREGVPEAETRAGPSIKHDISVPVAQIPALIEQGSALLESLYPGSRPVPFGHLGDGNLHFNLCPPVASIGDPEREAHFLAAWSNINAAFHDLVGSMGGSISAEHGIGQLKRAELARTADPVGLSLMRQLKATLDPDNRFNPGKLL